MSCSDDVPSMAVEKAVMEDRKKQVNITNNQSDDDDKVFINATAEKKLLWKLDTNLIPLLLALYLMSYMDRSNIGNAKIAGMSKTLHLDTAGNDYAWLLTIFYIGYIIFEFLALAWKIFPPHIWAFSMVLGFGTIAALQSISTSYAGMLALRFLLGSFEAGFGPGVPYFLSFFYLRSEIGLRIGLFLSAGPLATCFAGALAYGITSGKVGIANWRLLFLVEGLPSVVLAGVAFFYLPDSPARARFLDEEDKAVAEARAMRQVGSDHSSTRIGGIVWRDIGAALIDPKNYLTAMMYFSCNVSFSSLPVFLPTVLTEMGYTAIHAQGLSAPPYFLSFLIVIASAFIADRTGQRGIIIATLSLIGAIGYIILGATKGTAIRYFGIYLASVGIFPAIINILPWILNNQGSDTKRGAGIAITNLVGQSGPLLGTRIYPATGSPYYREGMWTCAAFMLFNGFLAIVLRTYLGWENKKLDARFGETQETKDGEGKAGVENDGPNFRYVL